MKKNFFYTDRDLLVSLKANDQFAFELLFYRYKNKVKGFIFQLAPSQIDPDEIVQKVFIKIWLQRSKIDLERSFSSFVFTIAKNEVIDQIRLAVNKKIYFWEDELIADLNISDSVDQEAQKDLRQQVDDLIGKIPERRRQIFKLSRFEGLTYKKIAEELHISENTVDTQIRKALNFLREEARKVHSLILFVLPK